MPMLEPSFVNFVAAGIVLYFLRAFFLAVLRWRRRFHARRHLNRYQSERDAYYNSSTSTRPTANRHSQSPYADQEGIDYVKDEDAKIVDLAEPKGFWTRLIMNEKIHVIREMIRISNSEQNRGYWQNRVEAQKRVDAQRQVREDGSQR